MKTTTTCIICGDDLPIDRKWTCSWQCHRVYRDDKALDQVKMERKDRLKTTQFEPLTKLYKKHYQTLGGNMFGYNLEIGKTRPKGDRKPTLPKLKFMEGKGPEEEES